MGRAETKCRRRWKPSAGICKATLTQLCDAGEQVYRGGGRNPFFRFLTHFRRCNREWLRGLPSNEVSVMAGTVWRCMSPAEKEPYVIAARKSSYVYWTRSQRINWVLKRLRDVCAKGLNQSQSSWVVLKAIMSWRQCVLQDLFNFEVE
ncbi:uncharacterized protein [Drosophila bipectinata]|uniref:uncharacterized protein n=1 Tax=Drosophila bipectinata TaxID=42026 RepID=UPI001C8AF038|nr:uncharacterized protein LOC108131688 [Drosophila bipectinata]